MAVIKCKMCGGDMEIAAEKTFGTCEFCGSTMTLPKVDDDQRAAMFNRGNNFRRIGEFDKALAIYENIVAEDDTDAEAHWCCALCRFGIEYVEDPDSYEYLPTCHRTSFDSFLKDVDYLAAVENSSGITRRQYQKEAAKIVDVQRGILATSQNEEPFDVFICYKESDENGQRTRDSLLAQDIYYQLTEAGRRVFFARITLEDKAGSQYEPYIFAALNSAKVMLAVGTKPEYLNAVWVKNEWSRFLAMMRKDRNKLLIPCYRDMDPYDLPEQLGVLQSYDMSKIGFMYDLIRGINKILGTEKNQENANTALNDKKNAQAIRGFIALENNEWEKAETFFEEALNQDAECAEAYLGKLMVAQEIATKEILLEKCFDDSELIQDKNFLLAQRFAGSSLNEWIKQAINKTSDGTEHRLKQALDHQIEGPTVISAGDDCSFGLQSDGSVLVAGELRDNQRGALDWTGLVAISAESGHIVGLKADGTVVAVGDNDSGQCNVSEWKNIVSICSGFRYTIGLKADGTVVAVGNNDAKQCNVRGWTNIVEVSTCAGTTLGLKSDGTVVAVGENAEGEGDVQNWSNIAAISSGSSHTVGLKNDGSVIATGCNDRGQCDVRDWKNIVSISAGSDHTVGLKADGTVVAVGDNIFNKCNTESWTDIIAVSAGEYHTIGLKKDGTIVSTREEDNEETASWRLCTNQQKLIKMVTAECNAETNQAERMRRAELHKRHICAGRIICADWHNTYGLKSDGTVIAVGNNEDGQCNVENWDNIMAISPADGLFGTKSDGTLIGTADYFEEINWSDIKSISHSPRLTVGLKKDGTLIVEDFTDYEIADEISSWTDIEEVLLCDEYVIGLKRDGTVVSAGQNNFGQCDVSDWRDIAAICIGNPDYDAFTVGLKRNGTVVAVGNNSKNQCDVDDWTDIAAIGTGKEHTIGLRFDGTVVATGANYNNQCEVDSWKDVIAIFASDENTFGLKSDGTVVAAGDDYYGQCNVSSWTDIVAVSASASHTVGLKSDGTVVATGDNSDGQCNVAGWKLCEDPFIFEEESRKLRQQKLDGQKEQLLSQIAQYQEKKKEFKAAMQECEAEKQQCQVKLQQYLDDQENFSAEFRRIESELLDKQSLQKKLSAEQKRNTAAMEDAKYELAGLHGLFTGKRRKELQSTIENLESQAPRLSHQIADVQASIDSITENYDAAVQKVTDCQNNAAETELRIAQIDVNYAAAKLEFAKLDKEIACINVQIAELDEYLE